MVCFTETPGQAKGRNRGGRHVEAGFVLGFNAAALAATRAVGVAQRKYELYVVGPVENVFYALPEIVRFDSWEEARRFLWVRGNL